MNSGKSLAGAMTSAYFAVEAYARAREAVAERSPADKKAEQAEANAERARQHPHDTLLH
jgi:hypothetical protein